MSDIFGKIEGVAGLALLGGLAYGVLKFGPGVVKSFKEAIDGLTGAVGDAADTVHRAVSPVAAVSGHGDAVRAALDAEQRALAAGDTAEAERQNAIAWQEAHKSSVDAVSTAVVWNPIAQAATRFAGDWVVDALAPRTDVTGSTGAFVPGSAADKNFDANLAKKQAEWQAAQDARTEAVKLLVQERNAALAREREAQRIQNEQQYNAWLQSTKPASSVSDFLNAGKQYQGQQEVAPGVYVAPSGAYQVIQDGQIVAAGSAGAVQGAIAKSNADMYPGTNYRREVVEGYQAKARAGDAAAAAWLKRFAPAGAV